MAPLLPDNLAPALAPDLEGLLAASAMITPDCQPSWEAHSSAKDDADSADQNQSHADAESHIALSLRSSR